MKRGVVWCERMKKGQSCLIFKLNFRHKVSWTSEKASVRLCLEQKRKYVQKCEKVAQRQSRLDVQENKNHTQVKYEVNWEWIVNEVVIGWCLRWCRPILRERERKRKPRWWWRRVRSKKLKEKEKGTEKDYVGHCKRIINRIIYNRYKHLKVAIRQQLGEGLDHIFQSQGFSGLLTLGNLRIGQRWVWRLLTRGFADRWSSRQLGNEWKFAQWALT